MLMHDTDFVNGMESTTYILLLALCYKYFYYHVYAIASLLTLFELFLTIKNG